MAFWILAADAILGLHLGFVLWVVAGAVFTRNHPGWARVHLVCLGYGVFIELTPLPCPLTLLEKWFEQRAGLLPPQGPWLLRVLDAVVYPHLPGWMLTFLAIATAAVNAFIYWRRARAGCCF